MDRLLVESFLVCACSLFVLWCFMSTSTQIEWTDATWNPVTGCTKITRGCDFCYAERFSERFRNVPGHPFESGFDLTLTRLDPNLPRGRAVEKLFRDNLATTGRFDF